MSEPFNSNLWLPRRRPVSMTSDESIEELLVRRSLKAMCPTILEVLQIANCMGDEIDEGALAIVLDDNHAIIANALEFAAQENLVLQDETCGRYVFIDDSVRLAIRSTVEEPERMCYNVGKALFQRAPPPYLSTNLCAIAKLFDQTVEIPEEQDERYRIASLSLEAGRKALSSGEFQDAARFLRVGIGFLKGGQFWLDRYDMTLSLFTLAADVKENLADFTRVDELVEEILANAVTANDKLSAYMIRIDSIGQQGHVLQAVSTGVDVLRSFGEEFPDPAANGGFAFQAEKNKVKLLLLGRSDESLLSLPPMQDTIKMAAMQILSTLFFYAYESGSEYTEMFAVRMVWLTLKYGLVKTSAVGFATYGLVVCADDSKKGYRFGQLALSLVKKTGAKELLSRVHAYMYGCIHHWTRPISQSLDPLLLAQQTGLERCDLEFAMGSAHFYGVHSLFAGVHLSKVATSMNNAIELMATYKQSNILGLTTPGLQFVQKLIGNTKGSIRSITASEKVFQKEQLAELGDNVSKMLSFCYYNATLAFLFGDLELADAFMERRRNIKFQSRCVLRYPMSRFTEGLVAVARIRQGGAPTNKYRDIANHVTKQLTKWARDSPKNFMAMKLLLTAEVRSLHGGAKVRSKVQCLYDESIELALCDGLTHVAAMASEMAGDYLHRCDESSQGHANVYWNRSCGLYKDWGALAKEAQLRDRIASFLPTATI